MRMISFDKLGARPQTLAQSPVPAAPVAPRGTGTFPVMSDLGVLAGVASMTFADAAPLAAVPTTYPEALVTAVLTAEIAAPVVPGTTSPTS